MKRPDIRKAEWYRYRLRQLVRRAVNTADPMHLLAAGAPKDTYSAAVVAVTARLLHLEHKPTVPEAASTTCEVLAGIFTDAGVEDPAACRRIGEIIIKGWDDCWLFGP